MQSKILYFHNFGKKILEIQIASILYACLDLLNTLFSTLSETFLFPTKGKKRQSRFKEKKIQVIAYKKPLYYKLGLKYQLILPN